MTGPRTCPVAPYSPQPAQEVPDMPNRPEKPQNGAQRDWRWIERWPDKCVAEVSRKGKSEPCDKPAVAVAEGTEQGELLWPVCLHHGRGRVLVPLSDIRAHPQPLSGVGVTNPTPTEGKP